MRYLFFDTETTGLPGNFDTERYGHTHSADGMPRFVELAWLKYTDRKKTGGSDLFVQPDDFRMPEAASAINGLTDERLILDGLAEGMVLNSFMLAARDADILIGHNIEFDIDVVASRLRDLGRDGDADILKGKDTVCTMKTSVDFCRLPKVPGKAYRYEGEYKYPRLGELHSLLFGCDFEGAHGAMADTTATARCFFELIKRKIIKIKIK